MIVQQRKKVGPASSLSFNGGDKPVPLKSLAIFGRSTQSGTPSPSSPVPIVSVGASGTITLTFNGSTYAVPAANGLRGIRVQGESYKCLVANGAYLITQDGARLKAR